jgi:Relaxase/Mobilisation nuclease domain
MIIKGGAAGSVGFWSSHLLRDDTNEVARVVEIKGLTADKLPEALREMAAVAAGSRSHGNFMYAANLNPQANENLTPEQWTEAVDTLERNLGFEGHQRVVVEHIKDGRQHYHVMWNRVDVDTMKVADITGNYAIHTATARDLENRFDLSPTPTPAAARERAPELWEIRAAQRSGIEPEQVKQDATEAWRMTATGAEFVEAIEARGYVVAQGDRRDFCLIDQAGTAHSLARRVDGAKAKDIRERMEDVDREALPTVADARTVQHERAEAIAQIAQAARADDATLKQDDKATFAADRIEREKEAQDAWRERTEAQRDNADTTPDLADVAEGQAALMVDVAEGLAKTLADFLTGFDSKPKTQEDLTREGQLREIRAQRQAIAALENIREAMEKGERLSASDIRHLAPTQIENMKARGDDALREMIQDMERRAERERDYGRARER